MVEPPVDAGLYLAVCKEGNAGFLLQILARLDVVRLADFKRFAAGHVDDVSALLGVA